MPKPALIKCRQCGKQIERESAIELRKGWYVCSDACAEAWQAAHAPKPKPTMLPDDRTALLDYIKQLDPDTNFIVATAQIKRMVADYGMTYAGMRYALWYSINVVNRQYKGISVLPYVYEDAKKYWDWQQRMRQQVADWMPQDDDAVIVRRDVEENIFV